MVKKIYDVESVFKIDNECYEICEQCEHGQHYYESDTGYEEITCKGKYPDDCQETITEYYKENGECENMNEVNVNEKEVNTNQIEMSVDLNSFKISIVNSIKSELRQELKGGIKKEIIDRMYKQVAEPQIENLKLIVSNLVSELVKTEIETYYNETKLQIGGGWNAPVEEFTIKEYTQKLLREIIEKGTFKVENKTSKDKEYDIEKHILNNCITSEISKYMDVKLKDVQNDVNIKVKESFETKLNNMMSEVALGVLKSNATFNDITQKLLG